MLFDTVLYVGRNNKISEILAEKSGSLATISFDEAILPEFCDSNHAAFDTLIIYECLETSANPAGDLRTLITCLKSDGKLILSMNNRMGIRFFCGDEDPYTGARFDGLEGYHFVTDDMRKLMSGHCYSHREITGILEKAGVRSYKRYSVFPNLEEPQLVYADGYVPTEDLTIRYFPKYISNKGVFLEEQYLIQQLSDNGLLHNMANAYLYECPMDEKSFWDFDQITLSMERDRKRANATILNEKEVWKCALYAEGCEEVNKTVSNDRELISAGIKMVERRSLSDGYVMPFIHAELANIYLQRLLDSNDPAFLKEMDKFRDLVMNSSDILYTDDQLGPILRKGYPDLVPLNCFHIDDEYVFFDQEYVAESYPANVILYRGICIVYWQRRYRNDIVSFDEILSRYGLYENRDRYEKMSLEFTDGLHEYKPVGDTMLYHPDYHVIHENRKAIQFSYSAYKAMFDDVLCDVEDKEIFVFGAGKWAKYFIDMYRYDVNIVGILDNNSTLWGSELYGYAVYDPSELSSRENGSYKVIICVRAYEPILDQLKHLGVSCIGIYDKNRVYPGRHNEYISRDMKKKYHIGYVAGVFDLFHIGHINLLRRAKENCDYLIVGVVSDEQVRRNKHKETYIPFDERLEVVRSCRYVDEAHEIPIDASGTIDAYKKYHFDAQFSGSDYTSDPWWLEQKTFLEAHGAELVFFPYTETTSSTKIQQTISTDINR